MLSIFSIVLIFYSIKTGSIAMKKDVKQKMTKDIWEEKRKRLIQSVNDEMSVFFQDKIAIFDLDCIYIHHKT